MAYAESDQAIQSEVSVFRTALTKLGWTEGVNLRLELRWGRGDDVRIGKLAKELVDMRPDVILGQTTPVTEALARATQTIPIVFVNVNDPVASGFVQNSAHPGGNLTGFSIASSEQGGKWVELLKEISPNTLLMALLFNPATGVPLQNFMPSIQTAASSFGVEVRVAPVHSRDEIENLIAAQASDTGGGLIVLPSAFNTTNREPIIALAARYRVPTIYYNRFYTESGGLISYGPNYAEHFRQARITSAVSLRAPSLPIFLCKLRPSMS
jgi:ABC-type uncharacterized transport system substrate-binding protein